MTIWNETNPSNRRQSRKSPDLEVAEGWCAGTVKALVRRNAMPEAEAVAS